MPPKFSGDKNLLRQMSNRKVCVLYRIRFVSESSSSLCSLISSCSLSFSGIWRYAVQAWKLVIKVSTAFFLGLTHD